MWETVIGLEIHTQLATSSKIFSGASTTYGAAPNTQACLVDLGMPGVLPVVNKNAIKMAIKFGLAVGAKINKRSIFARKNYFYPDLPKGYQISQYEIPIIGQGTIDINLADGTTQTIGITRAHLEEDAGKSLHEDFAGQTGIDLNRAGTPLLEIVSEPDMRSAEQAVAYAKTIHTLVRQLEISDGNMQEGSFRCDVNISIRPTGTHTFGTRTEIKNLNSFRFIERAINCEVARQIAVLENGGHILQETRLFDDNLNQTRSLRSKEEAHDYRYFPDPDLLPVEFDDEFIDEIRITLPELPQAKLTRLQTEYGISTDDANILINDNELARFFETTAKNSHNNKMAASWVMVELLGYLNRNSLTIELSPVTALDLADLIKKITNGDISNRQAKEVFEAMCNNEGTPAAIIAARGLKQMSDTSELEAIISKIINDNPNQVAQYKAGKEKLFGFFVGQTMKATKGQANPATVNEILKKTLVK